MNFVDWVCPIFVYREHGCCVVSEHQLILSLDMWNEYHASQMDGLQLPGIYMET